MGGVFERGEPLVGGDTFEEIFETLMSNPAALRPVDVYKAFIDKLVADVLEYGSHTSILSGEPAPETAIMSKYNALLGSLTPSQRKQIAELVLEASIGGVHRVLSDLAWWTSCHGVELRYRGEIMPVEFAEGWHLDFIGRLDEWEWPDPEQD
jgi:hypothetical protein